MTDNFYITTPIYYVNDKPHLGHAYTTIAADVVTRWHRLNGRPAYFLTGTDEHGQKVFEAAAKRGISPQQHVDELCEPFKALWARMDIQHDDFIRTTEPRHTRVVQDVLQTLVDNGDIYTADYEGWYSTSAERFWTEKDLVDGKCPDTGTKVEWIKEKNYFFRMSKYADRLRAYIAEHPDFLRPASRKNEVLGYLKKDVGDLCISRPKTRLPWGIPFPMDPEYVTYVWFDALLNYISAIGYHPGGSTPDFERWWPASYHLVGKDILTTHSVYWSTMLFAMGLSPAKCLYAHGWWTIEGNKMSKSIGNVVDPHLLIDCYGSDAVRYFLMREIAFGADGDFSHTGFMTRYNADLANDLGNLAHRALSMTTKWLGGAVPPLDDNTDADNALQRVADEAVEGFCRRIEGMQIAAALESLWTLVQAGNKYIDDMEPWKLNREGASDRLAGVMRRCLEICRVAAVLLSPVAPNKGRELASKLGMVDLTVSGVQSLDQLTTHAAVDAGEPLFPRMAELPERIQTVLAGALPEKAEQAAAKAVAKKQKQEAPVAEEAEQSNPYIQFEDFLKVQLKVGEIVEAEKHPNADRLLALKVEVGEDRPRSIVAGIAAKYSPDDLVGKKIVIVANLKPRKLRGVLSEGMLLAATGSELEGLVTVDPGVNFGSTVG
ncbi:MAG: methionine--tRNA ligase [Myxococcota bacterium]|nr:methionine--tRNA ligase [Myxococcota bacterium]MEC9388865.1 methionine--tRNA ligase [Myxococcota bacterium]